MQNARIVVMGSTGSGKTTLARALAQQLSMPHIELDALYWEPNWTPAPPDVFQARVCEAIAGERWVLDGNYSRVRDLIWARAELIIWLDFPFHVNLRRVLSRTLTRIIRRDELWSGNHESWRQAFFSRNSLLVWLFKSYWRHRRTWPLAFERYPQLAVIRLRSPREAARWLEKIAAQIYQE